MDGWIDGKLYFITVISSKTLQKVYVWYVNGSSRTLQCLVESYTYIAQLHDFYELAVA